MVQHWGDTNVSLCWANCSFLWTALNDNDKNDIQIDDMMDDVALIAE